MEKDKTLRQRLEERFPSDDEISNLSHLKCHTQEQKLGYRSGGKEIRDRCLTASEELIEKEREETTQCEGCEKHIPLSFANIDEDGHWTCKDCQIDFLSDEIEQRDKLLEEMVAQLVSLKSHWRRSGDDINVPSSLISGINKSISNYSDFLKGKEQ